MKTTDTKSGRSRANEVRYSCFPRIGLRHRHASCGKKCSRQEAEYIWHTEANLEGFDAVLIPSGASYGDYLRPGALAQSSPAIESLKAFAASGKPVLGVGNGFQILAEAGLLTRCFLAQ